MWLLTLNTRSCHNAFVVTAAIDVNQLHNCYHRLHLHYHYYHYKSRLFEFYGIYSMAIFQFGAVDSWAIYCLGTNRAWCMWTKRPPQCCSHWCNVVPCAIPSGSDYCIIPQMAVHDPDQTTSSVQGTLSLIRINFNPSLDKWSHA